MVDDVKKVRGQVVPGLRPAQDLGDIPGRGVRELLTQLPVGTDGPEVDTALREVASLVRGLAGVQRKAWKKGKLRALTQAVATVLGKKAAKAAARQHVDAWAVESATRETREQLQLWVGYLGITAEDGETEGLRELVKLLWPAKPAGKGSSFAKGSALRGGVKTAVMAKMIDDAVQEASRMAGAKAAVEVTQGARPLSEVLNQFARMGLAQMARALKRRRKKTKKEEEAEAREAAHARVEAVREREEKEGSGSGAGSGSGSDSGSGSGSAPSAQSREEGALRAHLTFFAFGETPGSGSGAKPDAGAVEPLTPAQEMAQMLELFCERGLETMHLLREKIAPRWAQRQRASLLQGANQHVVDTLLSGAAREELERVEVWGEIERLRDAQGVMNVREGEEVTLVMKGR